MALFGKGKSHYAVLSARKKEVSAGQWDKCKGCEEAVNPREVEANLQVCPKCGYHFPLTAAQRLELLCNPDSFKELDATLESVDALGFEGVAAYTEKLAENQQKTGLKDAVVSGQAVLGQHPFALGVMDFRFLGASMGSVVGEKITRLTEAATAGGLPLVIVTASGGARMYEGMLSLMQMAKTAGALERHADAGLPYVVIMTHPTTAGVTASFASLGDIIIAEPRALIGFAGPRVIKDTTQTRLPEGFQSAEFLLKKGLIDRIVERKNLRRELSMCLDYLSGNCRVADGTRRKKTAS